MDPNSGSGFSHTNDQELGKFIIGGTDGEALETSAPLPETYGDNKLVILPRDPLWFFAYWEATADRLHALRDQVGNEVWQKGQAVLRSYDVTDVDGDPSRAPHHFDTDIRFDARRWYINVPQPGRSYFVELGFRFPDGRFLALLGSNRITLPRGTVSDKTDSRWMIVNMSQWEKIFETPDPFGPSSAQSSKLMAQRWEFLRSVFSGSSSSLSSKREVKR